jgi:hypothetical protein
VLRVASQPAAIKRVVEDLLTYTAAETGFDHLPCFE